MESLHLPQLWEVAGKRFLEQTGTPLEVNPPKTIDDITKQIEEQQANFDPKDKEFKEKAKDATLNVLNCLKLVGGVAAQGASTVFGSANLCFSAVSLLLTIPKEVRAFHQAVDGLFEEVSVFICQFVSFFHNP
jgi:hypothetical protein